MILVISGISETGISGISRLLGDFKILGILCNNVTPGVGGYPKVATSLVLSVIMRSFSMGDLYSSTCFINCVCFEMFVLFVSPL